MVAVTIAVVVVLGGVIFGFWRVMRQRAEELSRTQKALREASAKATMLEYSVHDIANKVTTALLCVETSPESGSTELMTAASSLDSAKQIILEAQGKESPDSRRSAAQIFSLVADQQQRFGAEIQIERGSDTGPAFSGRSLWVERLASNVLSNAVREAAQCERSNVHLRLTDHEIVVVNHTRDARRTREAIDARVSAHGSTGLGLRIVQNCAEQVGWSVSFEVDERRAEVITRIQPRRSLGMPGGSAVR